MRLPFLQISMEVLELYAAELAITLEWTEGDAFLGLAKMFRTALARCPDHEPPSVNNTVRGPAAARIIAASAGWTGDPERFVDACEALPEPLLERVPSGIRFRGLDRYDAAWGKNHKDTWPEWKARLAGRNVGETAPKPGSGSIPRGNRTETAREPAGKQTGTGAPDPDPDPDAFKPPPNPPPASDAGGGPVEEVEVEYPPSSSGAFWQWVEWDRGKTGLTPERKPPKQLDAWWRAASADHHPELLCRAYAEYRSDEHFAAHSWPTAVFISDGVWRQRIPKH